MYAHPRSESQQQTYVAAVAKLFPKVIPFPVCDDTLGLERSPK